MTDNFERTGTAEGRESAERRHLTILFCDLVESTELAAETDPEDLHDLLRAYQAFCVRAIEEAGGYVARFAGDGILAYFGYPLALEDAAERAVHAALALRDVGRLLSRPDGAPLIVRIGIATGVVVIGDLTSRWASERAVAGETPNLAARLQALAEPGAILVSQRTRDLARGVFEFRLSGHTRPKGLSAPVPAWQVVGPSARVARYEGRRSAVASPLMSRQEQLDAVLDAWRLAKEGQRLAVGIVGEPGIGKSRLLAEVRQRIIADGPVQWLEAGGASLYDNTPFHVAAQIVRALAEFDESDGHADLTGLLGALSNDGGGAPSRPYVEEARRAELLALMATLVHAAARRKPTVLVVEDLHWVDPSSRDLLRLILKDGDPGRLLLVYTSRDAVPVQFDGGVHAWAIALSRLEPTASADLARHVGAGALSAAQVAQVVAHAGGVPLFIEELARMVAESPGAMSEGRMPSTLADLLSARLDASGPAKRYAQIGAVLGQDFPAALFAAMCEAEGIDPCAALETLEAGAIIACRDERTCAFRHALIAVAAYDSLLKRQRRSLHARAASLLLERLPALAETEPEILARHWALAGESRYAVESWEKAVDSAMHRRAFKEAEHACREALGILDTVHFEGAERIQLRLRAQLARILQFTQGYTSAESARASQMASELAERIGDIGALAREELEQWRGVLVAGDFAQAAAIADRIMTLAHDPRHLPQLRAFRLRAGIQHGWYTGDLARAERDFQAWNSLEGGKHCGPGDAVLSMGIGALTAQAQGRHAVAEDRFADAFAIAAQSHDPYDLAMAIHVHAGFHHYAADPEGLAHTAARLADVAAQSGFAYAAHLAGGWLAVADINAGRYDQAARRAQAAVAGFDRIGARISQVLWLGIQARAQWLAGDPAGGERTFRRAVAYNRQELAFLPETLMARGALRHAAGRTQSGRRDVARAARLSQAMGASLFQIRALALLADMHREAGDRARQHRALAAARALAHLDYGPAHRARFEALWRDHARGHGPTPDHGLDRPAHAVD